MRLYLVTLISAGLAAASIASAQTPTPSATLPAVTPAPVTPAPTPIVSKNADADVIAAIELLQELKAKNQETLKKQQATLEFLDQLQQEAEQLKIFAKRG